MLPHNEHIIDLREKLNGSAGVEAFHNINVDVLLVEFINTIPINTTVLCDLYDIDIVYLHTVHCTADGIEVCGLEMHCTFL